MLTASGMAVPRRRQALVTRPLADAGPLVAALAERGVPAIVEPLLNIRFLDIPADLDGVQAILCTSANGVRALAQATAARALPLLAVGDATADRARGEGFLAVESAGGAVPELAALAAHRLRPEAGRLVHVAGSEIAGDLASRLRAAGFRVDRLTLYEAQAAAALTDAAVQAIRDREIGLALFFSPRTAAIFAKLAADAGLAAALGGVTVVSISAATDQALAPLNWRRRLVAPQPNQASLLTALDRALDDHPRERAAEQAQ